MVNLMYYVIITPISISIDGSLSFTSKEVALNVVLLRVENSLSALKPRQK